jgi:hypothetical protein
MPYAITANSILQLSFNGQVLGQQTLTVLNYKLRSPVSIDDGKIALDQFLTIVMGAGQLYEAYLACLSRDYFAVSVTAQWVLATRHAYVRRLSATNGSVESDVLGPNAAFTIERRTEVAGPSGRGITHMGGVPQSFMASGSLSGDGSVAYTALGVKMVAPITTVSTYIFDPVLVRKAAIATSPIIVSADVNPNVRTMHRRTVGLGS